jgi:hypothetical protein
MSAATHSQLPGLPVAFGSVSYVMPCLNAATARKYWDRIVAQQNGTEPDPLGLTAALVAACLRRNYPEITDAQVEEFVDFDNVDELSVKCFGKGAFQAWCTRMATEGNVGAPQPTTSAAGTGAPSMPPSPPPPDGDFPISES